MKRQIINVFNIIFNCILGRNYVSGGRRKQIFIVYNFFCIEFLERGDKDSYVELIGYSTSIIDIT